MSLATAGIDCTVSPPLLGAMEDCARLLSLVNFRSVTRIIIIDNIRKACRLQRSGDEAYDVLSGGQWVFGKGGQVVACCRVWRDGLSDLTD